ncbi:MAG: DJ-1/PfpI family protein [Spirochaetes bacterium]|nr:DJ-1/PfpI family protein [Spirochaetota bacterium]
MKIIVPLAEGFEEIEAVTIIDVLRRAGIDAVSVYLNENPVKGAHSIYIAADENIKEIKSEDFEGIILPGGMPGSENLKNNINVIKLLKEINGRKGLVSAICAAPMVLGHAGLLNGKKAVCYPGFEKYLQGAVPADSPFVKDGNIITGKGPGCAMDFALEIVSELKDDSLKSSLAKSMQVL